MIGYKAIHMENVWKTDDEPGVAVYIPSGLVLLMALEDGWKVTDVTYELTEVKSEPICHITLQSPAGEDYRELIMPNNALIEKILAENRIELPVPEFSSL